MSEAAERKLLEFIGRDGYRPMPQRELLHRLHVEPADRPAMRSIIRRLLRAGKIVRIRGGKLAPLPPRDVVRGKLRQDDEGARYVEPLEGGERIALSPRDRTAAAPGAEVLVRLSGRRHRDGRLHGSVLRVVGARPPRARLGLFLQRGRSARIEPFDATMDGPLEVLDGHEGAAADGDVVRWAPSGKAARDLPPRAEVVEVLGRFDDPATDTILVAATHGLELDFPPAVTEASGRLARRSVEDELPRERFERPAPVTIDGETARDFDDAIAVERIGSGFRLFVHIADVASYVRPGDVIDEEAARRGTSVYFPDRVIPMLPEELSNDLCSLRPHEDRRVQSVVLDFDDTGAVLGARFADGVIRSAARLTYTAVAAALDGDEGAVPPATLDLLRAADALRERLERRRRARGGIDFDLPEPQILMDVEGVMTGITIEPRNRAHRMIEEFMIAANEAVARALEQAERETLYRIHEPPDPDKIRSLASFAARLGLELHAPAGEVSSSDIQRLLDEASERPAGNVVAQLALRSMSQARYAPDNAGHFGLASATYCHFTSPIRRYPDLIVHRQLRAMRRAEAPPPPETHEGLAELGEQCSSTERRAETAEREVLARKKLAFIAEHVGETFEGVVTGVAPFGLFVQLVDNAVEGLVRIERLGEEWFEHDADTFALIGSASGRRFGLGDRLRVTVDRVDRLLQRVDFSLESSPAPRRPPREGGRPFRSRRADSRGNLGRKPRRR